MATRWGAAAGELNATVAPTGLGLSGQPSALAVDGAHSDVTAFSAALAERIGARAVHVVEADTRYAANETDSANMLAAVASPVIRV
ncbi:hypothetical protein BST12_09925 [Mycobacterium angelicum]|uniref:Uncharacterized protein n=2 Tax=Mycobacterium angelicum TaxID=470074 RepID=A0A1W9ZWS5_MYCAN|nr:hypothetical protein [Mycobacterium angelicum]ORA22221.1 hypothetical protein BST12_09925 [Mycobacterium angelicum]